MRKNRNYVASEVTIKHVHELLQLMAVMTQDNRFDDIYSPDMERRRITFVLALHIFALSDNLTAAQTLCQIKKPAAHRPKGRVVPLAHGYKLCCSLWRSWRRITVSMIYTAQIWKGGPWPCRQSGTTGTWIQTWQRVQCGCHFFSSISESNLFL